MNIISFPCGDFKARGLNIFPTGGALEVNLFFHIGM